MRILLKKIGSIFGYKKSGLKKSGLKSGSTVSGLKTLRIKNIRIKKRCRRLTLSFKITEINVVFFWGYW